MKKFVVFLMVVGFIIGISGLVSADLLFDRGLPTANLNNVAGVDRSNVQWVFTQDPSIPQERWLVGDDFKIGGSGNYLVNTIRLWSTSRSDLSLWFGSEGGTITHLSSSPVLAPITYSNGLGYQGNSGNFSQIYQLDFNINTVLSGLTTYQFFLDDGAMQDGGYTPPYSSFIDAFLHSSNAGLSGSTQERADNLLLASFVQNGATVSVESWDSNGYGWDKSSDANVQVFGTKVPEPATMFLLGLGLMGLAGIRRKFKG